MIALLSALLGFLSSAFPDFLKWFRDKGDRAHEIAILKLQMEYDEKRLAAGASDRLQEVTLSSTVAERQALNAGPGTHEGMLGIAWVDALSGSVRPMLTYCFFALYAAVKLAQYELLLRAMDKAEALAALWTEDDMGIFAAVIAFWFGSRALGKRRA